MYFAVDPCNAIQMTDAVACAIEKRPDMKWFTLVDSAFDADSKNKLTFDKKTCLYDSDELYELLDVSPYLLELPVQTDALRSKLLSLARHRKNRPMLSFVASPYSAVEIVNHWKRLVNVKGVDGAEFILRFADTRILEVLPTAPDTALWDALSAPVTEWLYIDRAGTISSAKIGQVNTYLDTADDITLSDEQFGFLVSSGVPDYVINIIERDHPELLPSHDHAGFYAKIANVCTFGTEQGIEQFRDIVSLALYSLVSEQNVRDDTSLHSLLSSSWKPGALISSLLSLMDGE